MRIEEARRPHVRFETRAEHYVDAEGHSQYKNVYFAAVTPAGGNGKDQLDVNAEDWLKGLQEKARNRGGIDSDLYMSWHAHFSHMFDLYKQGQEMAVDGTPLRACLAFGPAQIAAAENVKIFSLEALAQASETEIAAIGMGGRDMKTKAEKMLQNLADSRVAEENAALRLQLSDQGTMITELRKQIENLTFMVESQRRGSAEPPHEMELSRRGPGRPPKAA